MSIYSRSDMAILRDIAFRIRQRRLDENISQQELAENVGLHRTTIQDAEQGKPFGILTLIQIMRGLNALEDLEQILPERGPSPIEIVKQQQNRRQRASSNGKSLNKGGADW